MSVKRILQGKCPRCGDGDIFIYPLSRVSKFTEMHTHCTNCEAPFEPEPGFYYGSLFVSYAFNVAIMIFVWVVLYVTINPADWVYGVFLVGLSLLLLPVSFRYSRILFLYWFGGLKGK
jgi:uncharacterized protein (DUF983 family)